MPTMSKQLRQMLYKGYYRVEGVMNYQQISYTTNLASYVCNLTILILTKL